MWPWRPKNSDSGESGLASCMCNLWSCTGLLLRSASRLEPGSMLCCHCLAIVNFCYWGPMRQRDVHISRRDTWMARKFFIFLYLKDAFFSSHLFVYIFILYWASPILWAGLAGRHVDVWTSNYSRPWLFPRDRCPWTGTSVRSGRCKGSKKDFRNKWEISRFLKEELDECAKGLRQKEQTV